MYHIRDCIPVAFCIVADEWRVQWLVLSALQQMHALWECCHVRKYQRNHSTMRSVQFVPQVLSEKDLFYQVEVIR